MEVPRVPQERRVVLFYWKMLQNVQSEQRQDHGALAEELPSTHHFWNVGIPSVPALLYSCPTWAAGSPLFSSAEQPRTLQLPPKRQNQCEHQNNHQPLAPQQRGHPMKQATEKGSRTICERMGRQRVKREKAAAKSSKSGSVNKHTKSPSSLVLHVLNTNQRPYKY